MPTFAARPSATDLLAGDSGALYDFSPRRAGVRAPHAADSIA